MCHHYILTPKFFSHECTCTCIICYCCSDSRIINGYNEFQETALKVPEDSKDMMDQIEYVQQAQTTVITELKESVEVVRYM